MNGDPSLHPLALYVHWPWCRKKCPYCDFNSHVAATIPEEDYVNALVADLKKQTGIIGERKLVSIFFGGGTPSLMSGAGMARVIDAATGLFAVADDVEITSEANPTSSSILKFKELKLAGVNRVSIGVQSFDDRLLAFLGREHSSEEARATVESACALMTQVNADFIYGLPDQSLNAWQQHLMEAIALGTDHLSAYQLTIEPNTVFYTDVHKRRLWQPMDDDRQADFFELTAATLTSAGFDNYEISNFAKPGKSCRHNIHVWRYGDYMGIGAGAHGRLTDRQGRRWATIAYKMPDAYLAKTGSADFLAEKTLLDSRRQTEEKLLMGLRLREGVDLADSGVDLSHPEIKNLVRENLIALNNGRLGLTAKGWPLLNSVLRRIYLSLSPEPAVGAVLSAPSGRCSTTT